MASISPMPSRLPAADQIRGFLAKYHPDVAKQARAARRKMRTRLPHAVEFVYDNYNALVFGYGPNERPSDAVLSLAVMPGWVTLCFLQGARLTDARKVLKGSGNQVRSVRLMGGPADLDQPAIKALVSQALRRAAIPMDPGQLGYTLIRSVSAKQRPRRNAAGGAA